MRRRRCRRPGDAWPDKETRDRRLEECVDVIRRLLTGETVNHDGLVRVHDAKLWEVPDPTPLLLVPAVSAETAARGARWADGLATIDTGTENLRRMLDAWDEAGGADHKVLQLHISWAESEAEAYAVAHDQWRSNVFPAPASWDLTRESFDAVSEDGVSEAQVRGSVLVSADLGLISQRIHEFGELGFHTVYLHHVSQDQSGFLDTFGEHVLPQFKEGV